MEKLILNLAAILIATTLAAGCSKKKEETETGIDEYTRFSGTPVDEKADRLEGTMGIRFRETRPTVVDSHSMRVEAQLLANGSAVTMIAYSSNVLLTDGVQLRIMRQDDRLLAEVKVNGETARQVMSGTPLLSYNPLILKFIVDFHNEANKAHIFVWSEDVAARLRSNALFTSDTNGQLDQPMPAVGGPGLFGGLRLENAVVTKALVQDAVLAP